LQYIAKCHLHFALKTEFCTIAREQEERVGKGKIVPVEKNQPVRAKREAD
jgi:hypothetical protein